MKRKEAHETVNEFRDWVKSVFEAEIYVDVGFETSCRFRVESIWMESFNYGSGYSNLNSKEKILQEMKTDFMHTAWPEANYPKLRFSSLKYNDLKFFRDYLKELESDLDEIVEDIQEGVETRDYLLEGIRHLRRNIGYGED